jgi:cytochrome c5
MRTMRFVSVTAVLSTLLISATAALAYGPGSPAAARPTQAQTGDDLPEGDGKKILQASCTVCHDLTEVTKFKGFYTRDDWRDIVKTMIAYGATVKETDVEVLVEYLGKNLGKK